VNKAAVAQWLACLTFSHQTWVLVLLLPIWDIGSVRKWNGPELLQCTKRVPIYTWAHLSLRKERVCIVKRPPKPRTLQHFCYIAKHLLYTVLTPEDILYRGVCACVFMSISVCKKVRLSSQHITVTLLAYSWTGGGLGFFLRFECWSADRCCTWIANTWY